MEGSGSIDLKELKRKIRVGAQGEGARVTPPAAVYKGKAAAAAEAAAATAAAATAAAARARRSRQVPEQLPALLQRLIAHAPASVHTPWWEQRCGQPRVEQLAPTQPSRHELVRVGARARVRVRG